MAGRLRNAFLLCCAVILGVAHGEGAAVLDGMMDSGLHGQIEVDGCADAPGCGYAHNGGFSPCGSGPSCSSHGAALRSVGGSVLAADSLLRPAQPPLALSEPVLRGPYRPPRA